VVAGQVSEPRTTCSRTTIGREEQTVNADVLVIDAGLAGLNAARELEAAGLTPLVLEASDEVGGRVRTDQVDGFRIDRGFQLINPAHPALKPAVDVRTLAMRQFGRGVAVRQGKAGPSRVDGLVIAGDADDASIQGGLDSGAKAAAALVARLKA